MGIDSNPTLDLGAIDHIPKTGLQNSVSSPRINFKEDSASKSKTTREAESTSSTKTVSQEKLKTSEDLELKEQNESQATTISASHRRSSTVLQEPKWESLVIRPYFVYSKAT